MKTQEELSERIRKIETMLIAAVMAGNESASAARKMKTEWEILLWMDSRDLPPEEAYKGLTTACLDHPPGRMYPPMRRRRRAVHYDSIQ